MKQYLCEWSTLQQKTKMRLFVQNKPILVVAVQGVPYAVYDKCPHESYPLSTGRMKDGIIECKEHGLLINLMTGDVADHAKADYLKMSEYDRSVRTFPTYLEDNKVYIDL